MLYIVTGADDVFAIDIDSGDILWSYEADLNPFIVTDAPFDVLVRIAQKM